MDVNVRGWASGRRRFVRVQVAYSALMRGTRPTLIAVLGVLVVTDLVLVDQSGWTVAVAVLASLVLWRLARSSGLTAADLGLGRTALPAGLRWGLAVSAVLLIGVAVASQVPFLAGAFDDDRTPSGTAAVLLEVLLVIPLRTVLLEELAFRGVLFALVARDRGERAAVLWSALAFGAWHVPPAFVVLRTNDALSSAAASPALAALVVLGIVAATAGAGLVLAWLRRRTGSLVAPALVHWTANASATLVVHLLR